MCVLLQLDVGTASPGLEGIVAAVAVGGRPAAWPCVLAVGADVGGAVSAPGAMQPPEGLIELAKDAGIRIDVRPWDWLHVTGS